MIFLSHILSTDTPSYANSGSIEIRESKSLSCGDTCNEKHLAFGNHLGTHIDVPFHFDPIGLKITSYEPDFWLCEKPFLINYEAEIGELISLDNFQKYLDPIPSTADLLLLKTGFERFRNFEDPIYCFQNPAIAPEIGIWLRVNRPILKFFGFDYISLSSRSHRAIGKQAHQAFLSSKDWHTLETISERPILLIEDMKLSMLHGSPKSVIIVPLRFEDADGAPVTVIANE